MPKKKKNYKPEETGMLLEDIREQLSVVAEGLVSLDKKVDTRADSLDKKVDNIGNDLEMVKLKVDQIADDVEVIKLESKIERKKSLTLEHRISLLEGRR